MKPETKRLLWEIAIELTIYAILLSVYFLAVLRWFNLPLYELFQLDPLIYAIATLLLIVVQSVVLEQITSFLMDRLNIGSVESTDGLSDH